MGTMLGLIPVDDEADPTPTPPESPPHRPDESTPTNVPPVGLTTRPPVKSEREVLEKETKELLGRRPRSDRVTEHEPTLKELSSVSFTDFIRETILGVPLGLAVVEEDEHGSDAGQSDVVVGGSDKKPSSTAAHVGIPTSIPTTGTSTPDTTGRQHGDAPSDVIMTRSRTRRRAGTPASAAVIDVEVPHPIPKVGGKRGTAAAAAAAKPPLKVCPTRLADGMSKVTLPSGWWNRSGIANDLTARGRHWAKGTKLGDMVINAPIKQCVSGIGGVYEYTLLELPPLTAAAFRTKADEYRKRQIGSEFDEDTSDEFVDGLARKFWKRLGPTMEASLYGADMEGTLFDGAQACGWNVDRLESCLQLLRADAEDGDKDDLDFKLPGVTSAYLYFGMWASVFAAHTEDMNLLSINYLHAGAPKYWYAIAPEDSRRFENLARSHFSGAASNCPEFLRHKRYLLSPGILKKAGINVTTTIQRAGDAMITFPGSYHFGFNTGFNIAESTNFAIPEWVSVGEAAGVCLCHPHSVRIDMTRLKALLGRYEEDMSSMDSLGVNRMSYSKWAKLEAKKKKRALKAVGSKGESDNEDERLPTTYTKGVAVEVMRSALRTSASSANPKKKRKRRKTGKKTEEEDWRLAMKMRSAMFRPQTRVLCLLMCERGDSSDSESDQEGGEKWFSGTISDVVEGHARIRFAGTSKTDDIWLPMNSNKLFIDGGSTKPAAIGSKQQNKNESVNGKKVRR